MPCTVQVKVKDPSTHLEIILAPEKVYIIRNHLGKTIKIGVFTSPKTGQKFRALLPNSYKCD
ncbi:chromatin protein Cren7 [Ignisphaera sp. 4213-co]|uniref:Chromatin protein Cren7 n=1 Tax=Ignisphaera cupida TaxID=3050454 RepID=A0ABD4Z4N9_9CREN|nr:chromatin protein Cren7 [Ignisphaera sp. 4213-co]MDK6028276.1 chromatin protein Cren7 [Ignisphaera sp. 4213-co]